MTDGNPSTVWKTDIYQLRLGDAKPGVGLLLDLGESREVARVEIVTPDQDLDLELWAGNRLPASIEDLERVDSFEGASGTIESEVSTAARYWVVWIIDLPGGGPGVASIGEVRLFGP